MVAFEDVWAESGTYEVTVNLDSDSEIQGEPTASAAITVDDTDEEMLAIGFAAEGFEDAIGFRIAESRDTNAYKTLNEALGLPAEPVSPSMFVPRLASDLECPDEIRQRAQTLAEEAEERGVTTGVHPAGFAAACLYKAGQEQGQWVTQRDVAESRNVTPTTVRGHHETLEEQIA